MLLRRYLLTEKTLIALLAAYCAASLLHFAHNAVYLQDYPNLPSSLTVAGVWAAWCVVTAVGIAGYFCYRRVSRVWGLAIIGLYALLGFGGFDHYVVAPMAEHSATMNLTIALEAATAALVLIRVAVQTATMRGTVDVPAGGVTKD